MSSPYPTQAPYAGPNDVRPAPRKPLWGGLLTIVLLSIGPGLIVGLFVWFIAALVDAGSGGDDLSRVNSIGAAAVVISVVVLSVLGAIALALLRRSSGFAMMNSFVQGLLAWLIACAVVGVAFTVLVMTAGSM